MGTTGERLRRTSILPLDGPEPDTAESEADALRRMARKVCAVDAIHQPRSFSGDGYGWVICVEDRQAWPCATVKAMEAANDAD